MKEVTDADRAALKRMMEAMTPAEKLAMAKAVSKLYMQSVAAGKSELKPKQLRTLRTYIANHEG